MANLLRSELDSPGAGRTKRRIGSSFLSRKFSLFENCLPNKVAKMREELRFGHAFRSVVSASSNVRISRSAMRKDNVDSAPWFSLARAGFDRLLVEASFFCFLRVEAVRADRNKVAVGFTPLHRCKPIERFEPGGNHGVVAAARSRADQSLRQSGIGVRKYVFKPLPLDRTIGGIRFEQTICQRVGCVQGGAITGERFEVFEQTEQGECAGARTLELHGRGDRQFKQTACGTTESCAKGSSEDGAQAPQGATVAVFGPLRLLPQPFIAQAVSEAPGCRIESQPEEGKIARGEVERAFRGAASKFFQEDRDDESAGVVIR